MSDPKEQPEEQPEEQAETNGHQEYNPSVVYEHVVDDVYYRDNPDNWEREGVEYKDNIIPPPEDEEENGKN